MSCLFPEKLLMETRNVLEGVVPMYVLEAEGRTNVYRCSCNGSGESGRGQIPGGVECGKPRDGSGRNIEFRCYVRQAPFETGFARGLQMVTSCTRDTSNCAILRQRAIRRGEHRLVYILDVVSESFQFRGALSLECKNIFKPDIPVWDRDCAGEFYEQTARCFQIRVWKTERSLPVSDGPCARFSYVMPKKSFSESSGDRISSTDAPCVGFRDEFVNIDSCPLHDSSVNEKLYFCIVSDLDKIVMWKIEFIPKQQPSSELLAIKVCVFQFNDIAQDRSRIRDNQPTHLRHQSYPIEGVGSISALRAESRLSQLNELGPRP